MDPKVQAEKVIPNGESVEDQQNKAAGTDEVRPPQEQSDARKENESDSRKEGEVDAHKDNEVGKNSQPSSEKPIEEQNNAHTESFETPYYEF